MIHLGDITKIKGDNIPPVDVITFGSPCQDLSIAGKRAGLSGERSGLFMEAVRIIKEMREATNGEYPKYAVWENVFGAFSSNKGEDFRAVLEELARIKEADISIPSPDKSKWAKAGLITGDDWSIAWRTMDAQYWGVPQRRLRISLVLDLTGGRAGEILFEPESLRGHFAPGVTPGQATAGTVENCAGTADRAFTLKIRSGCEGGGIAILDVLPFDTTQITSQQNGSNPHFGDPCHPLAATAHPPAAVCEMVFAESVIEKIVHWIVRRLTPTECEHLQGYPDGWTDLGEWVDSKGKAHKSADTPRYKALGNSIALPQWYYVLGGIADRLPDNATLGSLFDGIGGFPYVWTQLHRGRKKLCVWASEIEEFPIAVTKKWFADE